MKPKLTLPAGIPEDVARTLQEDVGSGDLTARLLPLNSYAEASVISRQQAIVCGTVWFAEVFRQLDPSIRIDWRVADGHKVAPDQCLCRLEGNSRSLLTGERSALNFLQTLSGTATLAAQYAKAVSGTNARILDTRKTLPGLRLAQKYAVACGGCDNHRIGLFDAVLIKENHISAAGSITRALALAFSEFGEGVEIEVEVENLDELREALSAGARRILLDNFSLEELRQAVSINEGKARLEASGGVNLATVRAIAETGVDDISVGGLTKDVTAVDLSLRFLASR